MGRWISLADNLQIFAQSGRELYQFKQGELIVGDPTSFTGDANLMVKSTWTGEDYTPMVLHSTDLKGATTQCIEMYGQGSFNGLDNAGSALTNLMCGYYNRQFFKAPILVAATPAVATVPATAGIYYKVLTGTAIYNSVTYTSASGNNIFKTDGSHTDVTGSGTFAICVRPDLYMHCKCFRDYYFAQRETMTGNEVTGYWNWDTGFDPQNSLTTTDKTFIFHSHF